MSLELYLAATALAASTVSLALALRSRGLCGRAMRAVEEIAAALEGVGSRPLRTPLARRKRYVVFRAVSSGPLRPEEVEKALEASLAELFGRPALAESRLELVFYDEKTGYGVLRVARAWRSRVLLATALARRVGERRIFVVPVKVTGSAKRARELVAELTR